MILMSQSGCNVVLLILLEILVYVFAVGEYNGWIVKFSDTPDRQIYLALNATLFPIANPDTVTELGFEWNEIKYGPKSDFTAYRLGSTLDTYAVSMTEFKSAAFKVRNPEAPRPEIQGRLPHSSYKNMHSRASDGIWAQEPIPEICYEQYLCTPSGLRWVPSSGALLWTQQRACAAFESSGVNRILFSGDSYMRHFYEALVLLLTNNYKNGAISSPSSCFYGHQFSEKNCRNYVPQSMVVCDNHLLLKFEDWQNLKSACDKNTTWFIWSLGNHPVSTRPGREGINNAEAYIQDFTGAGVCLQNQTFACELFWMSTHNRLREGSPGYNETRETYAQVEEYNIKMRTYMESDKCGTNIHYVDVFNMTKDLVRNHMDEAVFLTFDYAHWGMQVNLNKVQVFLDTAFST